MDITTSDESGIKLGWFGNQSGSWQYQPLVDVLPVNYNELAYDFKDLDGDNDLDVVYSYVYLCHFLCYEKTRYALFDSQTNSFSSSVDLFSSDISFEQVFIENLNDDDHMEVVFSYKNSSNQVTRYVFSFYDGIMNEITDPLDPDKFLIEPRDLNNDGIVDFMYGERGEYEFHTSNQGYNWSDEPASGLDTDFFNIMGSFDFDNNGETDLISSNGDDLVITFQGELNEVRGTSAVPVNVNNKLASIILILSILFVFVKFEKILIRVKS